MRNYKDITDCLRAGEAVTDAELAFLLEGSCEIDAYLTTQAREVCDIVYGRDVYLRGLIEISSYCKNDCYYCGIRRSNKSAERYRLTPDEIVSTAQAGYKTGFRTFVLQGGEDPYFTDEFVESIVRRIKESCEGCAVTLSLGERSRDSYTRLKEAGADRYLLRHETASEEHYAMLHPDSMKLTDRIHCLYDLKDLDFQVGCGFMVGSPYQTVENIVSDLRFIEKFRPHMVGIGPFIPHRDTPFRDMEAGSVSLTVRCLAIVRLMLPRVLLPATTALGSVGTGGRVRGLSAGGNVVMPNLSPPDVREKYSLYDGKVSAGAESAEGISSLRRELEDAGFRLSFEVRHSKM